MTDNDGLIKRAVCLLDLRGPLREDLDEFGHLRAAITSRIFGARVSWNLWQARTEYRRL